MMWCQGRIHVRQELEWTDQFGLRRVVAARASPLVVVYWFLPETGPEGLSRAQHDPC